MDAGLSRAGTPLALQHFSVPFLCTLQIQVRRAAAPLPMHTARRYPHTTPAVCCYIRQKYPCKSAVRFNPSRVPAFKTGVVPVCARLPGPPVSLAALRHPDQPVSPRAARLPLPCLWCSSSRQLSPLQCQGPGADGAGRLRTHRAGSWWCHRRWQGWLNLLMGRDTVVGRSSSRCHPDTSQE